eukprot:TRINITY_DN2007_c0_g1_i2.p1 TRINITY_DN2007_c0_g1~~TRINITY_DN2007_c0_g1_i2.p1  ORF type:complete len:404 (-),score=60.95 TRINITY_DN2007_c0_g1_i2:130-1341(-)
MGGQIKFGDFSEACFRHEIRDDEIKIAEARAKDARLLTQCLQGLLGQKVPDFLQEALKVGALKSPVSQEGEIFRKFITSCSSFYSSIPNHKSFSQKIRELRFKDGTMVASSFFAHLSPSRTPAMAFQASSGLDKAISGDFSYLDRDLRSPQIQMNSSSPAPITRPQAATDINAVDDKSSRLPQVASNSNQVMVGVNNDGDDQRPSADERLDPSAFCASPWAVSLSQLQLLMKNGMGQLKQIQGQPKARYRLRSEKVNVCNDWTLARQFFLHMKPEINDDNSGFSIKNGKNWALDGYQGWLKRLLRIYRPDESLRNPDPAITRLSGAVSIIRTLLCYVFDYIEEHSKDNVTMLTNEKGEVLAQWPTIAPHVRDDFKQNFQIFVPFVREFLVHPLKLQQNNVKLD